MPAHERLTPGQCRAARGFLDWTQDELAERTGLSRSTVRAFEKCHHDLQAASETRIVEAFREAGITFSASGPEGCRVCLKPAETVKPEPAKAPMPVAKEAVGP